jgi:hypothetical protein
MDDIVKIDENNIISILHSGGGLAEQFRDLGKPFSKKIFLVDCHIAGTMYVDDIDELEPELEKGKRLYFFREPENPHDNLAIMITDEHKNKLGYVPRGKNEILSRLMDAGKLVYGTIYEKKYLDEWLNITIQVFMDD